MTGVAVNRRDIYPVIQRIARVARAARDQIQAANPRLSMTQIARHLQRAGLVARRISRLGGEEPTERSDDEEERAFKVVI